MEASATKVVVLPVCLVLRWVRLSAACRGKKRAISQLIWEICPYYSLVSWLPASGCLHHPYNHTQVHVVTSMSCPLPPLENRCLPDCSCETPVPVMDLLLVAGHQQQCLVWKGELKGKQCVAFLAKAATPVKGRSSPLNSVPVC